MQTETLFRAARAVEVISTTIRHGAPGINFEFRAERGKLFVVLSGRKVGSLPEGDTLMAACAAINKIGQDLAPDDRFYIGIDFGSPNHMRASFEVFAA